MSQCWTGTGWHRKHYPGREVPKLVVLLRMELAASLLMRGWLAAGSFELVGEVLSLKQQLKELG